MAEPVDELTIGRLATVRGTVLPRDLMDSPLTGEPCVYYSYTVERKRRSRVGGDAFWDIVEQDEAILEFYIEDSTARAIVTPLRARIGLDRHMTLERHELGIDRQARQLLIRPGDRIEVTGEVIAVDDLYDEGRGYRAAPGRLMLQAPAGGRLEIRLLARR